MSPADLTRVASRTCGQSPADRYDTTPLCHPELPFTSHKRGIDETWDPAWGAGNSAFQTAAKDLAAGRDRPFAEFTLERSEGLRMTRYDGSNGQEPFFQIEPCLKFIIGTGSH